MAKNLAILLLLPALFNQAFCLQCNSCEGEFDCVGPQVTCEGPAAACTTSVRKAAVSFLEFQTVKKGCAQQLYPDESISMKSHLMAVSHQARYCDEDNCNDESYFVSHPRPVNHMRCHSCATQGSWCPEAARTEISCVGSQDQCLDLDITGNMGQFTNMKLKGCANLPLCQETLSFYSGSRSIRANCCDTPLCNSFTPALNLENEAPNGLECYSCVDEFGAPNGCSNQSISKIQCTGVHNMCLEGIGTSRKGGVDMGLITFKGCASPAMCQSSLLSLVQELEDTNVLCCEGSLCNSRIIDGAVTDSEVPADSTDLRGARECITPTPTATPTPSKPSPNSECVYVDYEYDNIVAAPVPGHATPSPESHTDKEVTETIREKEYKENSHSSPEDTTGATYVATDAAFVSNDLKKNESGAPTSGNHGNVVVLVPIIVSKKNFTTSPASSSSSHTAVKEDLANNEESEADECEADDEDDTVGEHMAATNEDHTVSSYIFTPRPGPSVTSSSHGTSNVATIGEMEMGTTAATHIDTVHATNSASEDLISGIDVAATTPVPKKKIPCKRPKVPKQRGANQVPSSRDSSHVAERSVMEDLQLSEIKDSGKVNYHNGAFGVAGNLGLLSVSLLLAALLH